MARERWADAVDTPTSSTSEHACPPSPVVVLVYRGPTLWPPSAQRTAPSRSGVSADLLGRWLRASQVPLPLALRDEVNSFIGWLLEFLCDMPHHRNVRMQMQLHAWQRSLRYRVAIHRLRWFQAFAIYGMEL